MIKHVSNYSVITAYSYPEHFPEEWLITPLKIVTIQGGVEFWCVRVRVVSNAIRTFLNFDIIALLIISQKSDLSLAHRNLSKLKPRFWILMWVNESKSGILCTCNHKWLTVILTIFQNSTWFNHSYKITTHKLNPWLVGEFDRGGANCMHSTEVDCIACDQSQQNSIIPPYPCIHNEVQNTLWHTCIRYPHHMCLRWGTLQHTFHLQYHHYLVCKKCAHTHKRDQW